MSQLFDARRATHSSHGIEGAWLGLIADDAETLDQKLHVTIPIDDRPMKFGPCRWQARGDTTLPVRGDRALVIFDNFAEPWIVAFWPFDETG